MSDDGYRTDTSPVMLIDRALKGGFEYQHDHIPIVFKPGKVERVVTADQARHAFSHDHLKVWTTDGQFIHRVAVKDLPGFEGYAAKLAREYGDEVLDQTPIELDTTRAEGWDTDGVDREKTVLRHVNIPAHELRERLATPGGRLSFVER